LANVKASNFKFSTQIGFGAYHTKITFRAKINGNMGWGSIQKMLDPNLFLQPFKLATSNLVNSLGLGCSLLRNNF